MKKVLFVTSEAVPFIKTGGLADVTGSLPKYFDKKKYDVRICLLYTSILKLSKLSFLEILSKKMQTCI